MNFFPIRRNCNFGDLGSAVKQLLRNESISSFEEMQSFMERYPDFRSKSINVSQHIAVMGELTRLTDAWQVKQTIKQHSLLFRQFDVSI
jgi:vacuolar protein sorting-associated protein 45